jgi:hypothetical protein
MIKATLATGVAGVAGLLHPGSAHADGDVTKVWNTGERGGWGPMKMVIYDIDNDYKRQDILGSALYELHTWFRDKTVYNNAYTLNPAPVEFVDDQYWKQSDLEKHPQEKFNTRNYVLWNQGFFMREADPFPTINIKPFYEKTDVWGYAPIGKVLTTWNPQAAKKVDITREFEVFVNLYHLGGGGINDHADMWSSVIAHEMLHNLGHLHKKGEYVDGRQINAFHRAVYCRGQYDGKKDVPGFG